VPVSYRDEGVEPEAPAALHYLGDAVDRDDVLDEPVPLALALARVAPLTPTPTPASAPASAPPAAPGTAAAAPTATPATPATPAAPTAHTPSDGGCTGPLFDARIATGVRGLRLMRLGSGWRRGSGLALLLIH
jgi:hypothetical protein